MTSSATISLRDIAAELNISVSLVSKVLSGRMGSTGVSKETRRKILAKVHERNFVPNRAASALRTRRTSTIGVFLHPWGEVGTEIASAFLNGFSQALSTSAFHLWLTFYHQDDEFYRQMEVQDVRRQADAIVLAGIPHPKLNARLHELEAAGMPVVTIFEQDEEVSLTNIAVDCFLQGKLPTDALLAAGCRNLVNFHNMRLRKEGFLAAHREIGLSVPPENLIHLPGYKMEMGRAATRQLLASGRPFDGIVAQSDHVALGALHELQAAGISVPGQVRLTGMDDSILARTCLVPLSSVSTEAHTIGRLTADMVLKRLSGETINSVRVAPTFIARESSL